MINEKRLRYINGLIRGDDYLVKYFDEQMDLYDALKRKAEPLRFTMNSLFLLALALLLMISIAGTFFMIPHLFYNPVFPTIYVPGAAFISVLGLLAIMVVVAGSALHRDLVSNLAERGVLLTRAEVVLEKMKALRSVFRKLQTQLREASP